MADFAFRSPEDDHWEGYRKAVHSAMDIYPNYGYRRIHALISHSGGKVSHQEVRDLMNDKRARDADK